MKARQKGKQNKKFEFIFQTKKDIQDIMRDAYTRLYGKQMPVDLQHILNDNLTSLYEE